MSKQTHTTEVVQEPQLNPVVEQAIQIGEVTGSSSQGTGHTSAKCCCDCYGYKPCTCDDYCGCKY